MYHITNWGRDQIINTVMKTVEVKFHVKFIKN